jgi:hypothetical protein
VPPVTRPIHVGHRARPAEGRGLTLIEAKDAKAVEQIAPDLLTEVGADWVVGPVQRYLRP